MANKLKASSRKQRKAISLEMKVAIIKLLDNGERIVDVARAYGMNRSTIATIYKGRDRIMEHVKSAVPMSSTIISKRRGKCIDKMEKLLAMWIEHKQQKYLPLSLKLIQEKARSLFEDVKSKAGEDAADQSFIASHGWFVRFKQRSNLNIQLRGETASADKKAAQEFPTNYSLSEKGIADNEGCTSQQIFNEIGLCWKSETDISGENSGSGVKAAEERFTPTLGGNASGDFELRAPVNSDVNPPDLENVVHSSLQLKIKEEDFEEILDWHPEELSNDDLIALEEMQRQQEQLKETKEPFPLKQFQTKLLAAAFSKVEEALTLLEGQDPNVERFSKVSTGIQDALQCYRFIYDEEKRKTTKTSSGRCYKPRPSTPAAASSAIPSSAPSSSLRPPTSAPSPEQAPIEEDISEEHSTEDFYIEISIDDLSD
ncbi:tigger transposable element-derived protein 1-like [Antennarius striatus]|uniref:tigger transposable element-derived protein 1-like n=1 Tax=Antennarius striatus TaxID=241820 RepID=UPI0035B437EA